MSIEPNPPSENESAQHLTKRARKRELWYAAIAFVLGFIVLPLAIFMVGTLLLGPYAGGQSLGAFLADFYKHLAQGAPRTWFIALSPYIAIWVLRLCFKRYPLSAFHRQRPTEQADAQPPAPEGRREPFIGS